jgi:GNAT superfamily N-acetyltransferase
VDDVSFAWAERRGFVEVGRNSLLMLDLTAIDAPVVEPPVGIEIVAWAERPDTARGMYEVACEAYPDIPGEEDAEMAPYDEWLSMDMQGAGDRPEATFVALANGEVVAYAKLSLSRARPTVAMHDITGVRRAWRGRGIARALKAAEIAWAKKSGFERLETQNEERNEPIRRLNERYGYVVTPGSVTVRGRIR